MIQENIADTKRRLKKRGCPAKDPCKKLRKKLKRQKNGLAKATTEAKRSTIQENIADTKRRLKKRGCKTSK